MKRLFLILVLISMGLNGDCQNVTISKEYMPPFKQGDATWKSFKNAKDRIAALQIPDSLITRISTKQLLNACLEFPYITDMYAYNSPEEGFENLVSEYNGFHELLKREDAIDRLFEEYSGIELAVPFLSGASPIKKGSYSFKCDLLARLFNKIRNNKGASKIIEEKFLKQTARNEKVIRNNPELFGTICKEAVSSIKRKAASSYATSWYEGEIVPFNDGRQYCVSSRLTPNNSEVIVGLLVTPDLDHNEKATLAYNVEHNYNAIVVGPATATYNCHAYAWHMHEGNENDEIWIGVKHSYDEDIYWQDGSYQNVSSTQATHVSYSGEHSAIRLGNGLYRSKWGAWPLVEHDSMNVPAGYGSPIGFYKRSANISGPSFVHSSATFSVNPLNPTHTVEWRLSNSYYNQHCLQQNYPTQNQCTITRNSQQDMINGTLTAIIKHNGVEVQRLTKAVYAYKDFYGQYTSDNLTGIIDYSHVFYVKPGVNTAITSFNLIGATVSYANSGTTPSYFRHDPTIGKLEFTMPTNNGGVPVIINVNDVYGGHYQLYAMPRNSYYLNITYEGDYINITLENDDEKVLKTMAIEQPWSYEIRNASMGALKASKSISTRYTTISTAGWPKGIYIIKARIGKEEVTEKIVVK